MNLEQQLQDFKHELQLFMQEIRTFSAKNLHNKELHKKYLTRKEVAIYLSIGLSTVDYWVSVGKLKKLRNGKTVRFDRDAIDQSLKDGNLSGYQSKGGEKW